MATYGQLVGELEKSQSRYDRLKKKGAEAAEKMARTVATVTGGAFSGYLDGAHADKNLMGMSLPLAGGLVLAGVGMFDLAGAKYSSMIESAGAGMLAVEAYKAVKDRSAQQSSSSTSGVGQVYRLHGRPRPITPEELHASFARQARAR